MPEHTTPSHKLDPRAPFVLDVRPLGRQAGTMREIRRSVPAPAEFGLELIAVPAGASIELDLRIEAVTEGVFVSGSVTAPIVGECGRCLDPVQDELEVYVRELFAYENSATDETSDEDEVDRIVDDLLDLEPVVRDAVVLALPLTPLCQPDCGGLCSTCGERLDDLPEGHTHESIDPRWAALTARLSDPQDGAESGAAPSQE